MAQEKSSVKEVNEGREWISIVAPLSNLSNEYHVACSTSLVCVVSRAELSVRVVSRAAQDTTSCISCSIGMNVLSLVQYSMSVYTETVYLCLAQLVDSMSCVSCSTRQHVFWFVQHSTVCLMFCAALDSISVSRAASDSISYVLCNKGQYICISCSI